MRRELARVRWWRRLAQARKELVVAQLSCPDPLAAGGMDVTLEALAADAPTSKELAETIWPRGSGATACDLDELSDLDKRLESYEARVSETLDTVTTQMVKAMGDARDGGVRLQSGRYSSEGSNA
ncbi:hypothetical protein [Demequina aurantiaca]|uniref:hypothetical protein n=1 Tax=Demequina aurantiaca TaxID=676200 RepID=UPI00128E1D65|nr:hypothetical protein [Demequina aurantiaca]